MPALAGTGRLTTNNSDVLSFAFSDVGIAFLPALHMPHRIVGRVLVELGKRRIVVAGPDEEVRAGAAQHRGEPDVQEL